MYLITFSRYIIQAFIVFSFLSHLKSPYLYHFHTQKNLDVEYFMFLKIKINIDLPEAIFFLKLSYIVFHSFVLLDEINFSIKFLVKLCLGVLYVKKLFIFLLKIFNYRISYLVFNSVLFFFGFFFVVIQLVTR